MKVFLALATTALLVACNQTGSPVSPSGTLGMTAPTGRQNLAGFEPCVDPGSAASLAAPAIYQPNQQGTGAVAIFFENKSVDGYDIEVQRFTGGNQWQTEGWLDVYWSEFQNDPVSQRPQLYGQFVTGVDGRFRSRVRVKGCRAVWSEWVTFGADVPGDQEATVPTHPFTYNPPIYWGGQD